MATVKNPEREKQYIERSKLKFAKQQKALILPNLIAFAVSIILFIILMIMDTPEVIFDDSSKEFSILLLVNAFIPLISFIIVMFATKTTHLLITLALNQLCVIPLIIGYFVSYDEMKNCSSYHMLIFYFFYLIIYLAMTTFVFNVKSRLLSTDEKK